MDSDSEDRKRKKKKKEKKKSSRREESRTKELYETVGYTNDNNPFGDADLGRKFVWKKKKKEETTKKRRSEEDYLEEIEQVRRRRSARERELADRQWQRQEEFRQKEAEDHQKVVAHVDNFHKEQIKVRSKVRLVEKRGEAIDLLAQNALMLEEQHAHDPVPGFLDLDLETRSPRELLQGADLGQVLQGARAYLELDKNTEFWREVVVICELHLGAPRRGVHGDLVESIDESFDGKSAKELNDMLTNIQHQRRDTPEDTAYWDHVAALARRRLAETRLNDIHSDILARCRNAPFVKRVKKPIPSEPPAAAAAAPVKEASREDPSTAAAAMVEREKARGMDDDEDLFTTEVATTSVGGRKPRYVNKIKTGFEWNKYNQAHYSAEEPPPKTVHGYKFNIFYPDLVNPAKPPTYKIEPCVDDRDFVILRFQAGPPYDDLAFRIVNQEWDLAPRKGFRCVFERGILQLFFNFKRWRYRR